MLVSRLFPACFFKCRYKVMWLFHCTAFRLLGVEVTLGGTLLALAFLGSFAAYEALVQIYAEEPKHMSGVAASIAGGILFFLAIRNSSMTLVAGVSYDRAITVH